MAKHGPVSCPWKALSAWSGASAAAFSVDSCQVDGKDSCISQCCLRSSIISFFYISSTYIYIYIVYYIYRLHGNMERRQCIPTEGTNVKANVLRRPVNWLIFLTRSHSPNYISSAKIHKGRISGNEISIPMSCSCSGGFGDDEISSVASFRKEASVFKEVCGLKHSLQHNLDTLEICDIYIYIYSMNCLFTRIYFRQKLRKASWKRQPQSNQISLGFLCGDLCQSSILHLVVLLGQKRSRWTTVKQWEASWDSYTSHRWKVSFFLYIYK